MTSYHSSHYPTYQNHIAGQWLPAESGQTFLNTSPAEPAKVVGAFPSSAKADVDKAVAAAKEAFKTWRHVPAPKRADYLYKFARLLEERKEAWSADMSVEMGKTLTEARGDVQEAIDMAYYMAGEGRRLFGQTTPSELNNKVAYTVRMPVGVCGLITPWNFPVAVPSWKLLPALVCGNTVVWKPAEDSPLMGQRFMELLIDIGLPAGVVNVIHGEGESAGQPLAEHPDVALVSFTGSTAVGRLIGEICGRGLKTSCLELGGKNAAIVLDDANLDLAVDGLLWGGFGTSGQRCTATSRFIVQKGIAPALLAALKEKAPLLKVGNPSLAETQVGPVINKEALDRILGYIALGKEEGATLAFGGQAIQTPEGGYYIEPTLFTGVTPAMRIANEEIFGPVVSLLEVADFDEAITVANGVNYGLSSSIYTKDINKAYRAIRDLEAGITYVNAPTIGAEVHLPFGGVKNTGNGHREAAGAALDVFTEWKTVYIDYSDKLQRAQLDN
jgi:alpha-ketoglutaric semialdehyde dehydrogenase